jgi:hypothetical protein
MPPCRFFGVMSELSYARESAKAIRPTPKYAERGQECLRMKSPMLGLMDSRQRRPEKMP